MPGKKDQSQLPVHGRFPFKSILPKFKDTAVALLNGDLGDALRAFSGALGGKQDEPEAQAYTLLWQGMKGAVRQILEQKFSQEEDYAVRAFETTQQFCLDLWKALPDLDLVIDRAFIQDPMLHSTTLALRDYFRDWIQKDLNLHESSAKVTAAPFPRYFLK